MRSPGDALAQQVLLAALGVRHEHGARVVDDAPVDLFGHAVVVAAVAGLHVEHRDTHALGQHRAQAAVGVAQDEQRVGAFVAQHGVDGGEHVPDLLAEALAA